MSSGKHGNIVQSFAADDGSYSVDALKSCITLRTLNYGNFGIFLIMGNAGFISSAVCRTKSQTLTLSSEPLRRIRACSGIGHLHEGTATRRFLSGCRILRARSE